MKLFSTWLEEYEGEIPEITGEYWIDDGSVQYADGDVGDYNHEALAVRHVQYQFLDKIKDLFEELGIKEEKKNGWNRSVFDDEDPDFEQILDTIRKHLEEKDDSDPDAYIQKAIGADDEAYRIISGGGDAKDYVVIHDGWIAVRGHNVDLYDYPARRSSLASGLGEIIEQESGFDNEFDPTKVDFYITDHKTGNNIDVTLADIENEPTNRPQTQIVPQMPANPTVDKRFAYVAPDQEENKPQPQQPQSQGTVPSQPASIPAKGLNAYSQEAKKKNLLAPGQQFWKKTSEGFSFKEWIATA